MDPTPVSRRRFLQAAGAAGLAGIAWRHSAAEPAEPDLIELSPHLAVYRGPIQVGILHEGGRALLIDCGEGLPPAVLRKLGVESVERVLFTHHHRDQAAGAAELAAGGAKLFAPAGERDWFANVEEYWAQPKTRWHVYNLRPHHLMLAESVPVAGVCAADETISWGPATIRVLATPGHTDGSLSYLVEVDGRRTAFSGDAIYAAGQVWDIHSLQKGLTTTDYHGFLGARAELVEGLARLRQSGAERLVPSHGPIIDDPPAAVAALIERLETCYDRYVAISALRHYFPRMFTAYEGRPGHMALSPMKPVPACLRHFGTTWLLVSESGAAWAMDCGSPGVIAEVRKLVDAGAVKRVEGLWVTHYHDNHVDNVPEFLAAFGCPCYADGHVAEVITQPMAWRLPCTSPAQARVEHVTRDGESWTWHEFTLTAFHFPGQTRYHGGLLVEGQGLRMLFTGDSFTPAGIDDYCTSNRNWLGADVGFDHCLRLIERLQPTHLFNCHVDQPWEYTAEQCRQMRENLAQRETLYGGLVPWEHANFGMDEPWARCFPYEQPAAAGEQVEFQVVVTNHAAEARRASCRAVPPRAWRDGAEPLLADCLRDGTIGQWPAVEVPAQGEAAVTLKLRVPAGARPGRHIIPVDLQFGRWSLPQFVHAIVVV